MTRRAEPPPPLGEHIRCGECTRCAAGTGRAPGRFGDCDAEALQARVDWAMARALEGQR